MSRWHSLRWRLPLTIFLLVTAILAAVIAVAYREFNAALITSGNQRARAAAGQVAPLIEATLRPATVLVRTTAAHPALRELLTGATPERLLAAEKAVQPLLSGSGTRIVTIWDVRGNRVLEVRGGSGDADGARIDVPAGRAPEVEGFDLQAAGDGALLQAAAIIAGLYPTHEKLGHLAVRSTFAVNPPGLFSRLLGDNATVLLGDHEGLWLDLTTSVRRTLEDAPVSRVRASAEIRDTPLQIHVAFPEAVIAAPARQFLERMLALGLVLAAAGAAAVFLLTVGVTRPLQHLTAATETVAGGDYTRKIESTRRDELGRLGRAFDAMTAKLAADLQNRERASRLLRENEERLRDTLHAARLGIWQVDLDARRVTWSETMGPLFGRTLEELPSQIDDALLMIHPEDLGTVTAELARDPHDSREHELSFRALQPDGSHCWLTARSRQIVDANGRRRLTGVCFDVTEERTLAAQLRQAQKMEAIGRLAGGVAHDFNNLLTAILGFGHMLRDGLQDEDSRAQIDEILKAGKRAADLTAQLLAFSRHQLVQPEVVDVNQAVDESIVLLQRLIGENIRLDTIRARDAVMVRTDPVQLQQVLMNLAINGRDAMPDGGVLTIDIAAMDVDASFTDTHLPVTPGPYVRITVTDTGVGMTDEVKARLFEPFFTTKKRGEGTGLGLSTVYGAVKQAGGFIEVEATPGRGSRFKVYFPRVAAKASAPQSATKPEAGDKGNETILLVEDEPAVRLLSRTMLERSGYRVIEAENAEVADRTHLAYAGSIRLLITDVVLPGSSGADLFRKLSIRDPKLKVLYMSGYTDDAVFRTGRLQRGVAFLQKPFTAEDLRRKTREVLDE